LETAPPSRGRDRYQQPPLSRPLRPERRGKINPTYQIHTFSTESNIYPRGGDRTKIGEVDRWAKKAKEQVVKFLLLGPGVRERKAKGRPKWWGLRGLGYLGS